MHDGIELTQAQVDSIVQTVPGGAANVQDVYPLSPAQAGVLFHCLLNKGGDVYVLSSLIELQPPARLAPLVDALQKVIARHDILRTAVLWENLPQPVQVVYRHAVLPVDELQLDPRRDGVEQMKDWMKPEQAQLNIQRAPLARLRVATTVEGRCYALLQLHHLACDDQSWGTVLAEAVECLEGREHDLPQPLRYRDHVAQTLAEVGSPDAESFFRQKLGTVDEPTAPFDLLDVHGDGSRTEEASALLDSALATSLRSQARRRGVSAARLFHAAWALVVAHTSSKDDVVFGTVLLTARQRTASQRMLGMAINTLPLRLRLSDATAETLVVEAHREITGLLQHQHASLALALQCSAIGGSAPPFTALLNYRHRQTGREHGSGRASIKIVGQRGARTNYPIALAVDDFGDGFGLTVQTDRQVDPQRVLGYVQTAVRSLTQALEQAPDTPALALRILPDSERHVILDGFSGTLAPFPGERLVHELFEEQARRTPAAVAVEYEGTSLSFADLDRRASRLAWQLRAKGVGPDRLVAICVDRSVEMIVGLLAILKAGGAYVPLDPNYPPAQLAHILNDAAPSVLLTQRKREIPLPQMTAETIWIDEPDTGEQDRSHGPTREQVGLMPHHLAYVIYTSGSTGKPKGVMIEHRCVVSFWQSLERLYEQSVPCCRVAVNASFNFDASVQQFVQLLSGRTIVLVPQECRWDAHALLAFLDARRIDAIDCTPWQLRTWIAAGLGNTGGQCLRFLLVGGEAVDPELWGSLARCAQIDSYNVYGPTENTVDVSAAALRGSADAPHIGRPMENRRIYVLDRHMQPVPVGVTGELYVGGEGVARGYLNRSELTAQRFVRDPFRTEPGSRMYKTGDVGRWKADGTLEYLGRNDHQVKIRGFRIELGEIEAQLARHESLKEAVVVAREEASGEKRLVAYVVAKDAGATPSADTLRAHLKERLPDHMIPSAFVALERMPLTPSGKLDRRVLPAPGPGAYISRPYEAPHGEVEELLARIWRTLLNAPEVGRTDNFFELGGHSLLIVQMLERLRRVGLCVDVRSVFESPTLADLARELTKDAGGYAVPPNAIPDECQAISPEMLPLVTLSTEQIGRIVEAVPGGSANVQDIYPLAPLQEGILFHHVLHEGGGDVYVVPTLLAVASRKNLDDLIAALQFVVDRHDVLRTAVLWEQLPQPVQVVYRRASLQIDQIALDPARDPVEQVKEWMRPERQRLDLTRAPLMRLQVAPALGGEWYVLMQVHHIVEDATSMRTLIAEVVARLTGVTQWPESIPYRNHVAQALASARLHDSEAFFRSRFGDVDEPAAPFGILDVHEDGTQIEEFRRDVDPELARRLRNQARSLNVSAATLFHAAWGLVVACCSGRADVVFGTVLLGRLQGNSDTKRALGMFINTLPFRMKLQGMNVRELVERTQHELVELVSHEQASLAAAQRCSGVTGSAPLFTALLNYRHTVADPQSRWSRATGIRVLATLDRTNYPITLSVGDLGEGFRIAAQTDRRIEPQRIADYLHTALESLVGTLEAAPQSAAATLPVLPASERLQVTRSFNSTQAPVPRQQLVHDLVEEQALRTPSAIAVEHNEESLTYAMLNARANQLARYLRANGATNARPVGIFVERSIEMVVGLLGILKAGAAYLPLDPNYPPERLQHMLEDAAPTLVLTQTEILSLLPHTAAQVIDLRARRQEIGQHATENLVAHERGELNQENLVYLIYTSGSTGRPKGTAMPHRAMVNLLEWHRRALSLCAGMRVLQFAALSFDVAFQEVFSTLSGGGALVLLDECVRRDVVALLDLLRGHHVNRLFVPPLMLQSLAEHCTATDTFPVDLRDVITAGEQLRIGEEIVKFFGRTAGCRLHNHYGPTETHVVTALTLTADAARWPTLPSIGTPIANTQIYILDEAQKPAPTGVPGEIYIGGANVALGYWQRPDATEARFVRDPFSDDRAARLYRTGDVGRWRPDGSIDYLGRNDHQVKIRGYRIELGEIEAHLAQHTAVKEMAVVAREDVPGNKRLVGYVVARDGSSLRAEELRAHLKASLPEHMVPSAWVVLDRLPLTPSGKLHRRALPAPMAEACTTAPYDPPQGSTELSLAQIWQTLLGVERVGRDDNFFELGAHSLLVLKALVKINAAMDCALKVSDIYRHVSVRELATRILQGAAAEDSVDLEREAWLDEQVVALPHAPRVPARASLVTGATGFVGRFLLTQLMRDTDATIYCLVRAQTVHQALSKLRAMLDKWDLWTDECETRVVAVPGDLRMPRLGMDERTYAVLAAEVDSIYHCATSMNHLETYAMAKSVNVDGSRELLKFATCRAAKTVNFISTLGVFNALAADTVRIVNESTAIEHERHASSRGYVASKWVGEKIFMKAQERGIPCNIFRVGLVWADAGQGRYDELQRGYRILKSCLLSGFGIENYRYEMPPTAVDYVARAIVVLAGRHTDGGGVFHVSAPRHPHGDVFERLNTIAGTSLTLVPYFDWILQMKRLHAAGWSLPAVPLIEFAFSMDREAFQARQRRITANVSFDCSRTLRELELAGIIPPVVGDDALAACINRMLATDAELQICRRALDGSDEGVDLASFPGGQVRDRDPRGMDLWR